MFAIFKKSLTVDQAAEALFLLMQRDFDKQRLARLSFVPLIDLHRAETEIILLDFFAIYFSLKFTRASGWQGKGELVFERLLERLVDWWGNMLTSTNCGTRDDAFRLFDSRLTCYSECINQSAEGPDTAVDSIGESFALNTFADDSFFGDDGRFVEHRLPELLERLSLDQARTNATLGIEVFNYRCHALKGMFDQFKVK